MTLDCGTSFWYDVNGINECDCLCYSQIYAGILALIQCWKMEAFKGCNHIPDFVCLFQTDKC